MVIYVMISLTQVEGFEWDSGNAQKSLAKHGVSQAESEQVFVNQPLLMFEDPKHSGTEPRLHAYGRSFADRLLHVTFTMREDGKFIRIISARPMSRKERLRYEEEI